MLNCYLKKCFAGVILMMLIQVTTGYAAFQDTNAGAVAKADSVTGNVIDQDNRPLKGASVAIKGSTVTAVTDAEGNFSISAPMGSVLVVSFPNHYVNEATVKAADKPLSIRLLDRFIQRPQEVDVLYRTQSRASVLGSVSTIYTNQLTTTPGPLFVYALPGQLAGLYTQQTSGFTSLNNRVLTEQFLGGDLTIVKGDGYGLQPTDNSEINLNIRGQGAITIVDGVQREIASLDPESIESISVLKDALSTIDMGINSSRNILLVTTRKADIGKPRISFTAQTGIQKSLGLPTGALPAYQWAYLFNEARTNDGLAPLYSAEDIELYRNGTDPYGHPDVNWFKTLLKESSPLTNYKLNVSGGSQIARYRISLNYLNQGGIFNEASDVSYKTNNNLSRYMLNSDISVNVTKTLNVDLQIFGRVQRVTEPGTGIGSLLDQLYQIPNNAYPIRNPDGSFGSSLLRGPYENNLLSQAQYSGYTQTNINDVYVNLDLRQKLDGLTQGLSLIAKGNVAIQSQTFLNRTLRNSVFAYSGAPDGSGSYNPLGSTVAQQNIFSTVVSSRYVFAQLGLDYARQFGKNYVTAKGFYDTRSLVLSYDLAAVTTNRALRVGYNYDQKYFIEGAVNYSGFNRYPPGGQNGFFWAGGLGWQMGNENFIKENLSWINSWKWRVSYGKTGNNNVGYYNYRQVYEGGNNSPSYGLGLGRNTGFGNGFREITPLANPNVTWEKAKKLDIGADIDLLNNSLQITADYFRDEYYDLLGTRGSSIAILGAPYPTENIGTNLFYGGELTLTYQNHINSFNYFISGNATLMQTKRVYFDEQNRVNPWNVRTGQPIGMIYGYKAIGIYSTEDVQNGVPTLTGYTNPQAGDVKYEDRDGNGVIDQFDQQAIGGLRPIGFYGGTLGFNYKGINFSVILQGVFNRDIVVDNAINRGFGGQAFLGLGSPYGQAYANTLGRWTPETASTATLPRLSLDNNNNTGSRVGPTGFSSSYYLKSGNYMRVKNAELGYTFSQSVVNRLNVAGLRVFVNAQNLFTISGYQGFDGMDPELYSGGFYPIQKVFNVGATLKL